MNERRIPAEITDRASDMITGVLWVYSPPKRVHTLFRGPNNSLVSAEAGLQESEGGGVTATIDWAGMTDSNVSIAEIADFLIENSPETALLCSRELADELETSSTPWIKMNDGDYRIELRAKGNIEVFVPTPIQRP